MPDTEWLASLKSNPTYTGVDIDRLFGKLSTWCRNKGKQPTRSRFINWLNREDPVILLPQGGNGNGQIKSFAQQDRERQEWIREESMRLLRGRRGRGTSDVGGNNPENVENPTGPDVICCEADEITDVETPETG